MTRTSKPSTTFPTPTPITSIYTPAQIELNQREVKKVNDARIMTAEESDRMQSFIEKMPLIGSDYEIGYSSLLGEFFIYERSKEATLEVDAVFQLNRVSDIRKNYPQLFNTVNTPVNEAITQKEDQVINKRTEQKDQ